MDKKQTGIRGEEEAKKHYQAEGYEVLEENYRHGRSEIDFIAITTDETLLVFVEVKSRRGSAFGEAETFVSPMQQERIKEAAEEYIFGINWKKDIRFDIACVNRDGKVLVFEDAF